MFKIIIARMQNLKIVSPYRHKYSYNGAKHSKSPHPADARRYLTRSPTLSSPGPYYRPRHSNSIRHRAFGTIPAYAPIPFRIRVRRRYNRNSNAGSDRYRRGSRHVSKAQTPSFGSDRMIRRGMPGTIWIVGNLPHRDAGGGVV